MIINMRFSEKPLVKLLYIKAQSADPAPPLGTVLGNLGASANVFCTNFNQATLNLPKYFLLKTTIYIHPNRSITFTFDLPSTSYILTLLTFELTIKVRLVDR